MNPKYENNITLYFLYSKTPEEERIRQELLKTVKEQFNVLPMPLKLYKLSKTGISYASQNKLMAFSFRKPIRLTYWIKGTNAEVEKFNDLTNSTSNIINSIMASFSEMIELDSEIELPVSDNAYLNIKKFINNQLLTDVNKKIGINLSANALAFDFEYGEHRNNVVAVNEGKMLIFRLLRKLKMGLPLNIVDSEKNHALKLAELLSQIDKIEAL